MLFFALEAAIFLAGTVLPTVVHLAFLPLAYAISETAGLNTLLLWISYYVALAFVRGRVPSIATHLLSMLSPVIALLPIAHLLLGSLHPSLASAALPFTAALDSALARQLIRSVIQFTPPVLAVVEGLATVFVVKLIGRVMQTSVDEDDRVRTSSRSSAARSSRARSSLAAAGRGGLQPWMRGASLAHSATAAVKGRKVLSASAGGALSAGAAQIAVAEAAKGASHAITTSMDRVSKRMNKPKVAIPLLAGTALALYQFYSLYTLLSDPQLRSVVLNVFGLCVAAMLAMVLLLQPGENDAPGAEALLLTMYATFVLTTAISPSSSVVDTIPVLRSGAAAAYQQASFGAKAMSLIQSLLSRPPSPSTPSSAPFLTRLASALSALLARLPWWTAVSLVYRGLVLGAVGAVLLDTNMDDGDDTESAASTVGETLLAVAAGLFTRPLVLLYYGRVIMEAFGYIRGTSTEIAVWLSVGTALVTQLALVVWRSRD